MGVNNKNWDYQFESGDTAVAVALWCLTNEFTINYNTGEYSGRINGKNMHGNVTVSSGAAEDHRISKNDLAHLKEIVDAAKYHEGYSFDDIPDGERGPWWFWSCLLWLRSDFSDQNLLIQLPVEPEEPPEPPEPPVEETPNRYLQKANESGTAVRQSGFVFDIYKSDGTLVMDNATTDSSGQIDISDLENGSYYAMEVSVPSSSDYLLDSTTKASFTITDDSEGVVVTFKNKEKPKKGGLRIVKSSDNQSMTSGNSNYSIDGAVFGIWTNSSCSGSPSARLTISGGSAQTSSEAYEEGTVLYVKEITPPKGHVLNTTIYRVTIVAGTIVTVNSGSVIDESKYGTPPALQKVDDDRGTNEPQGDGSLAGAIFTWRYTGGGRTVTWTTRTDSDGYTTLDDAHLVSGTLYKKGGQVILPIGHLTAQETRSPAGYDVNGELYEWDITDNGSTTNPLLTLTGDDLCPDVPEKIIRGGLKVAKIDKDTGRFESQGDADITGVQFRIVNRSDHSIIINGNEYGVGDEITEFSPLSVGADGIGEIPNGTLPYGTYEVTEVTPPNEGYDGSSVTFTVEVREPIVYGPEGVTFENEVFKGSVEMPKIDRELSTFAGTEYDVTPQGGATLAGARFQIVNRSKNSVHVGGADYAPGEVIATLVQLDGSTMSYIETDESGYARCKERTLPYGTYELTEIQAPEGYLLDAEPRETFEFTIRTNGEVAKPKNVDEKIDNQIIRGGVKMPKMDSDLSVIGDSEDEKAETNSPQGDATVDGAVFTITNANDDAVLVGGTLYQPGDIVKRITTVDGIATTGSNDLPYGTYELREETAPEGYLGTDEVWEFHIVENGVIVEPETVEERIDNEVKRGGVEMPKVDTELTEQAGRADEENDPQGDATVDGAEFKIVNRSANQVVVGGVRYQPGEVIKTLPDANRTDKYYETIITVDGVAKTTTDALPYGTYDLVEIVAPDGYHLREDEPSPREPEVWRFEIRENGECVRPKTVDEKIDNQVIRGGVAMPKIDTELSQFAGEEQKEGNPQGDATVEGAEFTIRNVSKGHVWVNGRLYEPGDDVMTIRTGENGIASSGSRDLPYGTYELRETKAPEGYLDSTANHDGDDGEIWTFEIRQEGVIVRPDVTDVESKIDNKVKRGGVEMPKIDTELSTYDQQETLTDNPQGNASVVGAEFTIRNESPHHVLVDGVLYPGTDDAASAAERDVMVIVTDENGIAKTAADALPYGTYTLRETKAPEGYHGTSEVFEFEIRENGKIVKPENVDERIDNEVYRGGVRMPKVDAALVRQPGYEKIEGQATGDATLDSAEFEIVNKSAHHVIVGGKLYEPNETIKTLPDANRDGKAYDTIITAGGAAATTDDALPYGTYLLREVKAPQGYELSSETYTFTITTEGQMCGPAKDDVEDKIDDHASSWKPEGDKRDEELSTLSTDDTEQPVADVSGEDDTDVSENAGDEDAADDVTPMDDTTGESEPSTTDGVTITDPSVSVNDIGLDKNPLTNAQGDATLEGAEFYLINRSKNMVVVGGEVYQPDERILTIPQPDGGYGDVVTSDATGTIAFGDEGLPYGTYELGEETAPRGYNLSDDTYIIELHGSNSGKARSSDEIIASGKATNDEVIGSSKADDAIDDTTIRGGLSVQKVDKETGRGDSIVTNAVESVEDIDYAANVPSDGNETIDGDETVDGSDDADADDVETGELSDVDVSTTAKSEDSEGDDGDAVLELGDDISDGSGSASDTDVDLNAFHRATLAGTMFEIRNASEKAVLVDGKLYQVGQVVKTITTDANGYAATEADALPYGTYDVYEVGAPNGYVSSSDSYGNADGTDDDREKTYVQTVEIREQGVIVPCARPFANQIKRGDIAFTKIDDDGSVMPHVAFRVTSKTTGESHIIVTDENGVYDSSSAVIPHSQNTNANDDAFDADGNIDDDALVHDAGTWFYGKADGKAFYADEQYTLPNYNDRFGASYVDDSIEANANGDATDGNIDGTADGADNVNDAASDNGEATNENDDLLVLGDDVDGGSGSMGSGSGTPAIVNPVYTVTDDEGASTDVTIGYVATDENGSFENNSVVFNSDGSITIVYDKTIVDMNTGERRSSTNYETYAEGNWSVKVASTNGLPESENGYVDADGDSEYDIVDNKYAYTDKWQFPMATVDDNLGAFPYDQYIFEELPSEATYGHNLVVFEATVQRHNYLLNLGPITDNIIDIHTTATDQADGDQILMTDGKVTIVDTVEYTNLNTDREYTMTGTLMDYETGEPMKDADGNAITSSVTFKPSSPNGSIDVIFELDASQLGGVQTVVFEDLYWNNIHIASHADIEDDGQRVEFRPEIGTTATADSTNDHFAYADGSVIITDTVHYKGVVPGREFIVHGILMDKNTGDALVDANGNTVENSVVFTPESSEGDVEVRFEFDASTLAGLDVVVFENLYRIDTVTNRQPDDNGDDDQAPVGDVPSTQRLVATHADINDEGQTVSIRASDLASDQLASDLVQTGAMIGAGLIGIAIAGSIVTYAIRKRHDTR